MGRWAIELYAHDEGESPVEEFINGLPTESSRSRPGAPGPSGRGGEPSRHADLEAAWRGPIRTARWVRLLYTFFSGRRIIILHGFLKKTRALPTREVETARARWSELKES